MLNHRTVCLSAALLAVFALSFVCRPWLWEDSVWRLVGRYLWVAAPFLLILVTLRLYRAKPGLIAKLARGALLGTVAVGVAFYLVTIGIGRAEAANTGFLFMPLLQFALTGAALLAAAMLEAIQRVG